jgi:hypothetical protein
MTRILPSLAARALALSILSVAAPSGVTAAPASHGAPAQLAASRLPIPKCPACGPSGCRAWCSGYGTTLKCWWVCPKRV